MVIDVFREEVADGLVLHSGRGRLALATPIVWLPMRACSGPRVVLDPLFLTLLRRRRHLPNFDQDATAAPQRARPPRIHEVQPTTSPERDVGPLAPGA